ncbi:MAG: hypothetical protein LBK06_02060 [Planctomycetaceae bacterium]|nr:hypothetical protein [Planctomycetaceae bacterium]
MKRLLKGEAYRLTGFGIMCGVGLLPVINLKYVWLVCRSCIVAQVKI